MNSGMGAIAIVAVALAAWLRTGGAQPAPAPLSASGPPSAAAPLRAWARPAGELLKEIDDPCTGNRWLLLRDAADPAGPGRLVLAGGPQTGSGSAPEPLHAPGPTLIIRAGDALIVEEHTARVDARLQAVALSRAEFGARFTARLKIGGRVVRVVAVAPGRAIFAPESAPEMSVWR